MIPVLVRRLFRGGHRSGVTNQGGRCHGVRPERCHRGGSANRGYSETVPVGSSSDLRISSIASKLAPGPSELVSSRASGPLAG
jgi:hypothetical protein